eukprot:7216313-Pyramimonas_sp.AAC.1
MRTTPAGCGSSRRVAAVDPVGGLHRPIVRSALSLLRPCRPLYRPRRPLYRLPREGDDLGVTLGDTEAGAAVAPAVAGAGVVSLADDGARRAVGDVGGDGVHDGLHLHRRRPASF